MVGALGLILMSRCTGTPDPVAATRLADRGETGIIAPWSYIPRRHEGRRWATVGSAPPRFARGVEAL